MKVHHLLVGLLLDIFDWLLVGAIPILGDIVDLVATTYFTYVLGPAGLAAASELVPLADVLPVNILLGLYADHLGRPPVIR